VPAAGPGYIGGLLDEDVGDVPAGPPAMSGSAVATVKASTFADNLLLRDCDHVQTHLLPKRLPEHPAPTLAGLSEPG